MEIFPVRIMWNISFLQSVAYKVITGFGSTHLFKSLFLTINERTET